MPEVGSISLCTTGSIARTWLSGQLARWRALYSSRSTAQSILQPGWDGPGQKSRRTTAAHSDNGHRREQWPATGTHNPFCDVWIWHMLRLHCYHHWRFGLPRSQSPRQSEWGVSKKGFGWGVSDVTRRLRQFFSPVNMSDRQLGVGTARGWIDKQTGTYIRKLHRMTPVVLYVIHSSMWYFILSDVKRMNSLWIIR